MYVYCAKSPTPANLARLAVVISHDLTPLTSIESADFIFGATFRAKARLATRTATPHRGKRAAGDVAHRRVQVAQVGAAGALGGAQPPRQVGGERARRRRRLRGARARLGHGLLAELDPIRDAGARARSRARRAPRRRRGRSRRRAAAPPAPRAPPPPWPPRRPRRRPTLARQSSARAGAQTRGAAGRAAVRPPPAAPPRSPPSPSRSTGRGAATPDPSRSAAPPPPPPTRAVPSSPTPAASRVGTARRPTYRCGR